MPLPVSGSSWPPKDTARIFRKMEEWHAWWAADMDALRDLYQDVQATRPSFRAHGLIGTVKRFFWGQQNNDLRKQQTKLHVPLAADICQASSDLLFAEPISATTDDGDQDVLDEILADGVHGVCSSGAEIGAALGGTYLRIIWDTDLSPHPFLDAVDADYAVPEFRWGRMVAVTFYFEVGRKGQTVYRHAERHEMLGGIGVVFHGLYEGTGTELGRLVPLTDHPATADIEVNGDGFISTETPGLAAVYVPNISPNRLWRRHPIGRNLGRSDLDGVEPLLDALDETYSSWMRDIRLGKARLIAGRTALEDLGPGNGAMFDLDREVYEGLNTPPGAAKDGGLEVEQVQFDIRYAEHLATAQELTRMIVRAAGYSAQTFGSADDTAMTATEVNSRDQRSLLTKGRKERNWKTALEAILTKALAVDAVLNRTAPGTVTVAFADGIQETMLELAQTAQALYNAQAASAEVRVGMLHPDWDETAIDEEVARIMAEFNLTVSDPDLTGVDGEGLSTSFGQTDDPNEVDPDREALDS